MAKQQEVTRPSVLAQAPCRADLAGGTLDLWPLYLFHPGAVTVNFALSILTTCRITPLPGKRIELEATDTGWKERFANFEELCRALSFRHRIGVFLLRHFAPCDGLSLVTHSESPPGAGISGSSALMIAATAALARYTGHRMGREEVRELAQNIEAQIIKVPTGCQDYYPALYGGVNAIHLGPDGIHREMLPVAPEEIESRFVLVYTGVPRQSGINNWEVFKRHINGDRKVLRNFEDISRIAQEMRVALLDANWDEVARLLAREWKLRRANYPGITTSLIEKLMTAARRNGGRAAKVCGAGGGGCVLFMAQDGAKQQLAQALGKAGGRLLPFRVAREGLKLTSTAAVR